MAKKAKKGKVKRIKLTAVKNLVKKPKDGLSKKKIVKKTAVKTERKIVSKQKKKKIIVPITPASKELSPEEQTLLEKERPYDLSEKESPVEVQKKISSDVMKVVQFHDSENVTVIITEDGKTKKVSRKTADYLSKEDYIYMDKEAYKFFKRLTKLHPNIRMYFDFNGLNLLDFVEEEFFFKSYFYYTIKDIIRAVGITEKIIKAEGAYKIILDEKVTMFNKTAALVCRTMGIPVTVAVKPFKRLRLKLRLLYSQSFVPYLYEKYVKIQKWKRRIGQQTKLSHDCFLFLPYYANHVDVMDSVIKKMKMRGQTVNTVEIDNVFNVTRKRLDTYELNYEVFEQYMNRRVMRIAKANAKEFRKNWKIFCKDREAQKALQYRKVPLWTILKPRLNQLFKVRFKQVSEYIATTRNMASLKHPAVMIYANDNSTYGRVANAVAKLEDIPSLLIQHGAMADDPRFDKISADTIAVEGPDVKKYLMERGVEEKKIVVTGQPRFDALALKQDIPSREEICKGLVVSPLKTIITLATQVPECDEKVVTAVCNAVKQIPESVLVIKMHPAERKDRLKMYTRIIKSTGIKEAVVVKDINLYGLLDHSALMITVFSTTATEAMMLDTPVITINLTREQDMMPYASSGAALGVYTAEDLLGAIDSVLHNKQVQEKLSKGMKKFVYDRAYKMDGKATARVIDLLNTMQKI